MPLVGGGGRFAFVEHFSEGGLITTLGGGGLSSGVKEGVLFFVSQVHFYSIFSAIGLTKCIFEVAGMPCNAVQCCGVLWSRKV